MRKLVKFNLHNHAYKYIIAVRWEEYQMAIQKTNAHDCATLAFDAESARTIEINFDSGNTNRRYPYCFTLHLGKQP